MTNIIPALKIIVLTNVWVTTATITPHYNGESNFNSSTVWIQRAEWIEKEMHVTFTDDGRKVESEAKSNQAQITKPDSPYVPGQPFWHDGRMWRFLPTNAPTPLSVIPFRYLHTRQEFTPIAIPPIPRTNSP